MDDQLRGKASALGVNRSYIGRELTLILFGRGRLLWLGFGRGGRGLFLLLLFQGPLLLPFLEFALATNSEYRRGGTGAWD